MTKFDCSTCDIIVDSNDEEQMQYCKSHNHEHLIMPSEENGEAQAVLTHDEYQKELLENKNYLIEVIEKEFPNRSFAVTAALSVKAQQMIFGITQVFTMILMGNPSSYKSTILEIVSVLPHCYVSDAFTPKSFVSHSANSKKNELGKVDLLPRIRHQTLITSELAPLFSGNPDQLLEYFGMLTRILDGRGFQSDSGVHGRRGYTGDFSFMWLGAVVEIPHRVWKLLGNLGAKMYFLRLPNDTDSTTEKKRKIKQILKDESYTKKVESAKTAITRFWNVIEKNPQLNEGKIIWDKERDDDSTINKIIDLAIVLAKLRGTIPTWFTSNPDSGGTNYNYETPIIEQPNRASNALYNLARGHAVLCGRNYITDDDLAVVVAVTLSSASRDRVELFKRLLDCNGKQNTEQFMESAKVSRSTALKEMKSLVILELVDMYDEQLETKPVKTIKLKDEYHWFLSLEFKKYMREFDATLNPENSKLSQKENLEKNTLSNTLDEHFEDTPSTDLPTGGIA
ncbi:hypothetical protein [Candidatus Nitrosarchaeum limnium]|jgi:predicted transcriptional regulator|nr:hypothetical protein [Candidatus Nitrosarchaeum limnium]